jgi:deoxycytidine triphosphate deaminase
MILGVDILLEMVDKKQLVSGLSERELFNPEGCGFDLRLGKVHRLSGEGYLGIEERKTCDMELVAEYREGEKTVFELLPGESVLTTTVEAVKLPDNLTALLQPRSTLYRNGVIMRGGNVAPGYEGVLSFLLLNASRNIFRIEMGARYAHILFFEVKGTTNKYRGQWQGGRVGTKKLEKQV